MVCMTLVIFIKAIINTFENFQRSTCKDRTLIINYWRHVIFHNKFPAFFFKAVNSSLNKNMNCYDLQLIFELG